MRTHESGRAPVHWPTVQTNNTAAKSPGRGMLTPQAGRTPIPARSAVRGRMMSHRSGRSSALPTRSMPPPPRMMAVHSGRPDVGRPPRIVRYLNLFSVDCSETLC
jgi:hypothetical protein